MLPAAPAWMGLLLACAASEETLPAAPDGEVLARARDRGVAFLVQSQNPDGSWGGPRRTKGLNIYAPVPGAHHAFRTAVTALCVSALIEDGGKDDAVRRARERGEAWLVEELPRLRRATPAAIYNVWGHAYAIQALAAMLRSGDLPADRRGRLRELIRGQVDLLGRYETVDGGWGYYDFDVGSQKPAGGPNSFTTATVLIAFHDAKDAGVEVPPALVARGLACIRRQRKPDFTYAYAEGHKYRPMGLINRPGGSLGRSQACNLALRLWGDERITDQVLSGWLRRLIDRNLWLDIGRKRPIPHESWFQVAGYFYYYGHYYAALCLDQLPRAERQDIARRLASILVRLQESDGSWWDYPLYDYHQPYGTAFALMTLRRLGGN